MLLSRYLLRMFLPAFALTLALFSGILWMNQFLRIFSLAVMKGISPSWVLGCFTRLLPFLLSLSIPMAYLVALLLTIGQCAESGEMLALRSSGFSFFQITSPFLASAAVLAALLLYLDHKASPEAFHAFREQFARASQKISRIDLEPGTFMHLGPFRLYAAEASGKTGLLRQATLLRSQGPEGEALQITAPLGRIRVASGRELTLDLEKGEIIFPNRDPKRFTAGAFDGYRLSLPLTLSEDDKRDPDLQELATLRLLGRARNPKAEAYRRAEAAVEISLRSAVALSPLVFFWLGTPLGLLGIGRHGRGAAFGLSLVILLAYYGLITLGINLGRRHAALAYPAPWAADALGLVAGGFMVREALKH